MQIDIHKRNNEFTNIYCNYNKHLNYEAFYYMCENNRIFLQDKNCCPNCTNKSINQSLFYNYLQKMATYDYNR